MDTEEQVTLLKESGYLDEQWYLKRYPDVAYVDMCPATHYIRYGWRFGRDPSPKFSTEYYINRYPDVSRSGMNPLVHFLRNGKQEGRETVDRSAKKRSCIEVNSELEMVKPLQPIATSALVDENSRHALQLQETQHLLEYYFQRCQELELELHK